MQTQTVLNKQRAIQTVQYNKVPMKTEGLNTREVIRERDTVGENKVEVNRTN